MAAVVERSNWCKLLLALFLLVSLSFAPGLVTDDTSTEITFMDISGSQGVIVAKLYALTVEAEVAHDEPVLIEAFREAEKGNQQQAETLLSSSGMGQFTDYLGQIESETVPLTGAEVNFYYLEQVEENGEYVYVKQEVAGCVPATEDPPGSGEYVCALPDIYGGTCTDVYASFGDQVYGAQLGDRTYPYIEETIRVCDKETTSLAVMRESISGILMQGMGGPLCFASILVGGMLLASMFFAGRSPLSLLDITTPLLPKAKSISYGGLRMGTGFGRMGAEMGAMGGNAGLIAASSKVTTERLLRYLRSKGGYSKRLVNLIMSSGADEVLKMMALRALISGKGEKYLQKILSLSGKNLLDPEYQEKYGKLLADLASLEDADKLNKYSTFGMKRGESLHDAVIQLSQMNIFNAMQAKAFADSTGEVPAWFKTPLGKSLGRLPFIGTHIMGGTASLFFGGRHIARFYKNTARGAVRAIGDMATPKGETKFSERVQMAVDDARRKNLKPGRFESWVALKDDERQFAKMFDTFEYGSALYKRTMKEAKKDVLNWLVGTIISHYGGKFDLTREEVMRIGFETPEQLMFKNMKSSKFAKMEAELRKILADANIDDIQKAKLIMKLMNSEGISYDQQGARDALAMLLKIDRRKPSSTGGDELIDFSNEDAVNCHRLMRLQMYLQEHFKVDQYVDLKNEYLNAEYAPGKTGRFFFMVGRPSASYVGGDFTFATFFRSKYREALETSTKAGEKPLNISDIANYAFLRVVNERWGIFDPNTPGLDAELKLVMRNAENWLRSLVNPGAFDKKLSDVTMAELMGALYAKSGRDAHDEASGMGLMGFGAEYGPQPGAWRLDMKAHWKTHGGPMGGAKMAVENQADGEVNLAHNIPMVLQDAVDRGIPYDQAAKKYTGTVVESHLFKHLKGMIEQDNPNTYFTSQLEFDRFRQLWASYKAYIARREGISDERKVTDAQVAAFIKERVGIEEVSKGTFIRLREGSVAPFIEKYNFQAAQSDRILNAKRFIRRGGYWEEFSPEKFYHNDVYKDFLAKDNVIRRIIGAPDYKIATDIRRVPSADLKDYHKAMDALSKLKKEGRAFDTSKVEALLRQFSEKANAAMDKKVFKNRKQADSYAALAGRLLYEYSDLIKMSGGDHETISNQFSNLFRGGLADKVRLELMYKEYFEAKGPTDRERVAERLKEWARNGGHGEERHVKVALLFNQYGESTGNWHDLNTYNEVMKVAPGATHIPRDPDAPKALPYEQVGGIKGFFKNVWNMGREVWDPIMNKANLGLEQFMMSTFGKQMRAEYEGSITSEYFRQTGAKFAAKLAAGDFGDMRDTRYANDPALKQYNALMDSFTRYHAIWDETITRDPRGNSSAIGSAFIYSSFFHHGPAMAFGPGPYRRWTYAGYQTPWTTWSGIKRNVRERLWGLQYVPAVFNWAVGTPFGVAYRTYITSRWGFMSKHDRKYKEDQERLRLIEDERATYYEQSVKNYQAQMERYQAQFNKALNDHVTSGRSAQEARELASMELAGQRPSPPSFELERNILRPYSETQPRTAEGQAAILNWFYASFDPTASNWKRFAASAVTSPLLPIAQFIPSRWLQTKVLGSGTPLLNRDDINPYYVSPQGLRAAMMHATGPMVKRQYGGTEIVTGVVRSHEDTWGYQSGVYAIWGNTNPGVSYMDFSNSLHMDPRAANYLRYESRFKPFMQYDEYVSRQANLGLVKRDIDPYQLMSTRNSELRHYKFPENTLFRFLNPATFLWYKGGARLRGIAGAVHSAADYFRETPTNAENRGGRVLVGGARLALRAGEAVENFLFKHTELRHAKSVRYCQKCGGPVMEGGTCNACARKIRCPYCSHMVNPAHNHSCSHGIHRNLLKENLSGAYENRALSENFALSAKERWRNVSQRTKTNWGRES